MERKLRRIITGHNDKGKSIVKIDGSPFIPFPGFSEMWITDNTPADNKHQNDTVNRAVKLEPPPKGTILRFFEANPNDPSMTTEQLEEIMAQGFAGISATHCRTDTSKHPGMHTTKTVDYVILLEGEVTLLLDEDEVDLKPFDVVVQRGTNHAWVNKGNTPALLAAVLIDAEPL